MVHIIHGVHTKYIGPAKHIPVFRVAGICIRAGKG